MIDIIDGFNVFKNVPVDSRIVKADLTERDAIPSAFRYEGLSVYVVSEQRAFRLVGGITDIDWAEIEGVDAYTKAETDQLIIDAFANFNWKPAVSEVADLETTYPTAQLGWVCITTIDGGVYYYNGTGWESAGVSASQLANKIDKISGGVEGNIVIVNSVNGLDDAGIAHIDLLLISVHRGLANGVASLDPDGLVPVSQIPGGAIPYKVVPDITARDALTTEQRTNRVIHVVDATGDPSVESGSAGYWWDESVPEWVKTYEGESTDVTLEWGSILNGPSSTPANIDDSVAKKHSQNTDQYLDQGGANEVTATEVRGHIDDEENPHNVTKTQLGLSNVENKSSAEIRAEIQETDIPPEIARDEEVDAAIQNLKGNPSVDFDTLEKIEQRIGEVETGGLVTSEEIDSTIQLGGVSPGTNYPVGTPIENIIKDLIAPYQDPEFTSLAISATPNDSILEVGRQITINEATFAFNNDSEGNPPQNMYLSGEGFDRVVSDSPEDADPGTTVQKTTDTTETWILSGEDKDGGSIPDRTLTKTWRFMHCFGASNTILTGGSLPGEIKPVLDALHTRNLQPGKAANVTCTAQNDTTGYYTYIAYPSKYGELVNVIQNGSLPVLSAFTLLGTFSYQNDYGHNEDYYIYKSNADKAFASGTTLAIS